MGIFDVLKSAAGMVMNTLEKKQQELVRDAHKEIKRRNYSDDALVELYENTENKIMLDAIEIELTRRNVNV